MRWLLDLEIAAFARLGQRRGAVLLGVACALTGALALEAAIARLAFALHAGSLDRLRIAFAAAGLGFDLLLVLASFGLGLALAAIARPARGAGLFFPAARTSAGIFSVAMLGFFLGYVSVIGLARLGGALAVRLGGNAFVLAMALACTPTLLVLLVLGAGSSAAMALVARGVSPGQAVAVGLDHALRRPARVLGLFAAHAATGLVVLGAGLLVVGDHARILPALAPLASLCLAWTVAAFDAALARDPRLATG